MRRSLVVKKVEVRRMYGMNLDLALEDLSEGVNVVHGPNAAGKTTLGRALHGMVWPESLNPPNPTVQGRFRLDDVQYDVDIEGGKPVYRQDGREAHAPGLPDVAQRERYRLPLHLLLRTDDRDFVQLIQREATGGLDVMASARSLGFSDSIPRTRKVGRSLEDAQARVNELTADQRKVAADRERLEGLKRDRQECERAAGEARQLQLAIEVRQARRAHDAADNALADFDPALASLRIDDLDSLTKNRERILTLENEIEKLRRGEENLEQERLHNPVVGAGEPTSPVKELESRCGELDKLEGERKTAEERLTSARERRDQTWRRLGGRGPSPAVTLDSDRLREIERLIRDHQEARLHLEEVRRRDAALGTDDPRALEQACDRLQRAAEDLQKWLHTDSLRLNGSPLRRPALVAAALLAAVAVIFGIAWHPAAWLLLIGTLALTVVAWQLPTEAGPSPEQHRVAFERRGVGAAPSAWTREEVGARVTELQEEIATIHPRLAIARRREGLGGEAAAAEDQLNELRVQRDEVLESLGLDPESADLEILPLARALADWYEAQDEEKAQVSLLKKKEEQIRDALGKINQSISVFGEEAVADVPGTRAATGRIRDLYHELNGLDQSIKSTRERLRSTEENLSWAKESISRIFHRVGIEEEEGADDRVQRLHAQRKEYQDAVEEEKTTRQRASDAIERFSAQGGKDELLSLDTEVLETHLQEKEKLAASLTELSSKIGGIERVIEGLLKSHQLEEALAKQEEALHELRELRDETVDQNLGHLLADHVSSQHRQAHLPRILEEAQNNFLHITNGRYKLDLPRDKTFVALDTEREREFTLDELSSGTRVQLLLAVRLGFIAVEEEAHGIALPIVLDEVLANSDDERAEAVMDAVIRLADQGRQVVYFSVQPDEVAKWAQALDGRPHKLIPLRGASKAVAPLDGLPGDEFTRQIPEADGHDLDAYRKIIDVPAWSGWDEVGQLHLWYLVDSPTDLVELMRAGFGTWGPLQAMLRRNLVNLPNIPQTTLDRIDTRARALKAWREAWLVGRGRPVYQETLKKSGAVSDDMLDRVYAAAKRVNHDARRLLEADIKRFHQTKREELRDYLAEEGFLDEAEPLSDEQIWEEVVRQIADHLAQSDQSLSDIRDFLGRVRTAAANSPASDPVAPQGVSSPQHEPDRQ